MDGTTKRARGIAASSAGPFHDAHPLAKGGEKDGAPEHPTNRKI